MAFLFGGQKKGRDPKELIKALRDSIAVLAEGNDKKKMEKASEETSKALASLKFVLYGDASNEPNQDHIQMVCHEANAQELIQACIVNLSRFEFEAKKDVALIFNCLLRKPNPQTGKSSLLVDFISNHVDTIDILVAGYEDPEVALNMGSMLRECCRHEALTRIILYSANFWKFFGFVELSNFDVASDAFATFKDFLTKHKTLVAEFIGGEYDAFFAAYTQLLHSDNYVTRRQSLKLLGEMLLDRANFSLMTKYISNPANLKLMMNLLRDRSRSIQFEAFHVFKVFVANPHKTQAILDILSKNKDKLVEFLSVFQNEREDEQFSNEKAFLIKQIGTLNTPNAEGS